VRKRLAAEAKRAERYRDIAEKRRRQFAVRVFLRQAAENDMLAERMARDRDP
jgi:hypothetical protein